MPKNFGPTNDPAIMAAWAELAPIPALTDFIANREYPAWADKAKERGVRFGRKTRLVPEAIGQIRKLREAGKTVPEIIERTGFSKASIYRALTVPPARRSQ